MMGAMFYLALLAAAFCFVTGQPRSEKQWLGAWSVVLDDTFTKSQLETLHNSTRFNVTVVKLSSTMNFIQCQKENGPLRGTHFLETNGNQSESLASLNLCCTLLFVLGLLLLPLLRPVC
eukprot:m.215417 g.215417  ORF g.215417 m.215417 type:complete len:119 (+) comp33186_c2_seq19:159-515(+)